MPPPSPIDTLEAALREAEADRDAARAAYLQSGTDNRGELANWRAAWERAAGRVEGIQQAINTLTGGAR